MSSSSKKTEPLAKPGQYDVGRRGGVCAVCQQELIPGEKIMAALRESSEALERLNISLQCWPQLPREKLLAFWATRIPLATEKKKVFVDDAVLCELFERLADVTEPGKLNFRFVLGLILMRKKLLIYDTSRNDNGKDIWTVRLRGKDGSLDLLDPHLDEQQVMDVSRQLDDILSEGL